MDRYESGIDLVMSILGKKVYFPKCQNVFMVFICVLRCAVYLDSFYDEVFCYENDKRHRKDNSLMHLTLW